MTIKNSINVFTDVGPTKNLFIVWTTPTVGSDRYRSGDLPYKNLKDITM